MAEVLGIAHELEREAKESLEASCQTHDATWALVEAQRAQVRATLYLGNVLEDLLGEVRTRG